MYIYIQIYLKVGCGGQGAFSPLNHLVKVSSSCIGIKGEGLRFRQWIRGKD
jgi:hypothetical protein